MAKSEKILVTNYQDFSAVLSERFDGLSKQLKTIARFVLENPNITALNTTSELAQEIGVQPSSLIRFAQALGFSGFSDLQSVFRTRLLDQMAGRSHDYPERIRKMRDSGGAIQGEASGDSSSVLNAFIDLNHSALAELAHEIDTAALNSAVDILRNAESVYIIGQRRSFHVASYLYYCLSQLDVRAFLIDSVGGFLPEQTGMIGKNDALIAITFPKYTDLVLDTAMQAGEAGCPVISITDSAISPVVSLSDVSFITDSSLLGGFRSVAASMCLAQALIVGLG